MSVEPCGRCEDFAEEVEELKAENAKLKENSNVQIVEVWMKKVDELEAQIVALEETMRLNLEGYKEDMQRLELENERLQKMSNGTNDLTTITPPEILHTEYKRGFDEGYQQGEVSEAGLERKELEAKVEEYKSVANALETTQARLRVELQAAREALKTITIIVEKHFDTGRVKPLSVEQMILNSISRQAKEALAGPQKSDIMKEIADGLGGKIVEPDDDCCEPEPASPAEPAGMKDLLDALRDCISGYEYMIAAAVVPYGVGAERCVKYRELLNRFSEREEK